MSGDKIINENFIITHKLIINLNELGINESDGLRFKIYSALSL
jgi:hypothetical protein